VSKLKNGDDLNNLFSASNYLQNRQAPRFGQRTLHYCAYRQDAFPEDVFRLSSYLQATFTVLSQQGERAIVCVFPTSRDSWRGRCPKWGVVKQSHAGFISLLKHVSMGVQEVFCLQICKHKMLLADMAKIFCICTETGNFSFKDTDTIELLKFYGI
jgi:hypothetical protein